MQGRKLQAYVTTYTAAFSESREGWMAEMALQIFEVMNVARTSAPTITYIAAISAREKGWMSKRSC